MKSIAKRAWAVCFLVTGLVALTVSPCLASQFATQDELDSAVHETILRFQTVEPRTADLFRTAYGYAVFPRIDKGAAGIAGANGQGLFFENGRVAGYACMSQFSLGVQVGGGTYAQVIFFQSRPVMEQFMRHDVMTTSQTTVARAETMYSEHGSDRPGLQVFTMGDTGVFLEASAGAEKVWFYPIGQQG